VIVLYADDNPHYYQHYAENNKKENAKVSEEIKR
jgi:hypothetical protein